jgi:hypothetical protein
LNAPEPAGCLVLSIASLSRSTKQLLISTIWSSYANLPALGETPQALTLAVWRTIYFSRFIVMPETTAELPVAWE